MSKQTLYITGVPGSTVVFDPRLAYGEVMLVMREGKMLVETSGIPGAKEFQHDTAGAFLRLNADTPIGTRPGGPLDPVDNLPEEFIIEVKN